MKRTALKRKTPMRRGPPIRRTSRSSRKGKNAYANRPRAPQSWWDFVHAQRCAIDLFGVSPARIARGVPVLALPCSGKSEANHMGERIAGFGTIAHDRTAVKFCKEHHRQWTEYDGLFSGLTHGERREYATKCIEATHELARRWGVEIPDC